MILVLVGAVVGVGVFVGHLYSVVGKITFLWLYVVVMAALKVAVAIVRLKYIAEVVVVVKRFVVVVLVS